MEIQNGDDSAPMAQAALRSHALFFGNLNNELPKPQVAAMILQLAQKCTGMTLDLKDVKIRYSLPSNCFTATLKLPTPDVQQTALTSIGECEQIPNGLVKIGRTLRVDVFQRPSNRKKGGLENTDEGFLFLKGQHLGAETRTLEFKEMSNLNLQYLRKIVAKYVCAFLNSSGGALMLGVDDRGDVQGTPMSHKQEDDVRLAIDQIIKNFDPPVLPQMYSVLFIPVHCQHENSRPTAICKDVALKVIKLIVSPGRPNTLYATQGGDVFIRRDGSVQGPLKPREIQEWCHINFDTMEKAYQEVIAELQSKLRQAEYKRQSSDTSMQGLKKSKSSVCTIL